MPEREKELQRIETFSDGVFAIAVTLLILEVKVPHQEEIEAAGGLLKALLHLWPSYLAYVLSFGSILIIWINHHRTSKLLARSSKTYMFSNGFLLLTVTFIPFPTAILAEYITEPNANVAVMFYSSGYLLTNIGFNVWWQSMLRPVYLLKPDVTKAHVRKLSIQCASGLPVYLTTTIISYWFPIPGLIIIFGLFFLWIGMAVGSKGE